MATMQADNLSISAVETLPYLEAVATGDPGVESMRNRLLAWDGQMHMDGAEVTRVETLVPGIGRVRDVRVGPDGYVYLAIEDRNGGPTPVVRLEPVPRTEVGR